MDKTRIDKAYGQAAGLDGIHFPLVISDFTGDDYEIGTKMELAAKEINREISCFKVVVVGCGEDCIFPAGANVYVRQFLVERWYIGACTPEIREEADKLKGLLLDTAKRLGLLEIRKG